MISYSSLICIHMSILYCVLFCYHEMHTPSPMSASVSRTHLICGFFFGEPLLFCICIIEFSIYVTFNSSSKEDKTSREYEEEMVMHILCEWIKNGRGAK